MHIHGRPIHSVSVVHMVPGTSWPSTLVKEAAIVTSVLTRVVKICCQPCTRLQNQRHEVLLDNFFTSYKYIKDLQATGVEATGTIKATRMGGAMDLLKT